MRNEIQALLRKNPIPYKEINKLKQIIISKQDFKNHIRRLNSAKRKALEDRIGVKLTLQNIDEEIKKLEQNIKGGGEEGGGEEGGDEEGGGEDDFEDEE